MFFHNILTNPIISEISFLWRHHFSTLWEKPTNLPIKTLKKVQITKQLQMGARMVKFEGGLQLWVLKTCFPIVFQSSFFLFVTFRLGRHIRLRRSFRCLCNLQVKCPSSIAKTIWTRQPWRHSPFHCKNQTSHVTGRKKRKTRKYNYNSLKKGVMTLCKIMVYIYVSSSLIAV